MSEVTRYDLTEDVSTGFFDITPVPERMEGRYVTYEDYSALQKNMDAECANLRQAIDDVLAQRNALEQRAEAAEAKLAELEKQEPVVEVSVDGRAADDYTFTINKSLPDGVHELFTRPAPAVSLAELVPGEMSFAAAMGAVDDPVEVSAEVRGWNACRDAILRNIEEAK